MTMWTHLSDATVIDVIEGTAEARARSHAAGCERCRVRVQEAREAWGWIEHAAVPEPVPSYWDVSRRRVGLALEAPAPQARRPFWAAAAAAGAAVIALVTLVPARVPVASPAVAPASGRALPAWSALPPADEDPGLPVLEEAAPLAAAAVPGVECSDLSECVVGLTDDESRALADVLRQELRPELHAGTTL
jgi:hypothetical protein